MSIFDIVIVTFPLDAITFSVFYYYFAPLFFKRKNIRLNILLSFIYIILYGFVWIGVYYILFTQDYGQLKGLYFSSFGHCLNYGFLGILLRLGIDWFEKRESRKGRETQNVKTELALLRAQINPHFLFNTLNNINSFATQKSEKTSYAIMKLSEIMRYMLYDANGEKVLLDKEIQYIESFLELHKLRYKDASFVKFRIIGDTAKVFVPPMLFIPFIENAFKHGKKGSDNQMVFEIEVENKTINFKSKNYKRVLSESEQKLKTGIGIQNIKKRLEYLYPNNFNLEIQDTDQIFAVHLMIQNYEN